MKKQIKVLHIIPSLKIGGAERITFDICKELASRENIQVCIVIMENVVSFDIPENLEIRVTNSNVKLSKYKKNHYDLKDYVDIVNNFKPDIIHSHLFQAEIFSRALLIKEVKYVTHVHDNMIQLNKFELNSHLNKRISNYYEKKWILKRYKKVNNYFISISSDTTNFLKQTLSNKLQKNIFELNNAINVSKFSNNNKRVIGSKIKLITIGSLVDKKNQILLINLASDLKFNAIPFDLIILGDGPNFKMLHEEINHRDLQEHVHLMGNVKNVEFYINNSDLLLHSALYEPFGLVLLEAMSSGLPVICLDGRGNRDIILTGKNGFLLSENNSNLFYEKILYFKNNPNEYEKMSNYAKKFAKKYDIINYVDRLTEIYLKIID
jgi:glycosyltransferase involved in cell wall biosynthesis